MHRYMYTPRSVRGVDSCFSHLSLFSLCSPHEYCPSLPVREKKREGQIKKYNHCQ